MLARTQASVATNGGFQLMSKNTQSKQKPVIKAGKEPEVELPTKAKPVQATEKTPEQLKKEKLAEEAATKEANRKKKEEDRTAAKKVRDDKREADKKARLEAREQKKLEKANKPAREVPAHMAKVKSYRDTLPPPSEGVQEILDQAKALSAGDLCILANWISLEARERATVNASKVKVEVGDKVKIISGQATKFIGKEGEVSRTNRIRIFVKVPGFNKEVYLFASDVEKLEGDTTAIDISEDDTDTDATAANG